MTREQFVENYLKALNVTNPNTKENTGPDTRVVLSLIGSIYDLQNQVNDLQETLDEIMEKGL